MRLKTTISNSCTNFYIIKDYKVGKKRTTKIVESLGNIEQVKQKAGKEDYMVWIKKYIAELNEKDKNENRIISLNLNPKKELLKNKQLSFNGGYLFLQDIYYDLGLDKVCSDISDKYQFKYDLSNILANLIYSRVIYPSSKLSTFELSKNFIEQPNFELQHIYRALEVIAKETDFIQAEVYKNSLKLSSRNTGVLYYDCTNYFFEIEEEENLKQYGVSKEHRPSPIVEMGLFLDGDGIPLAFNINAGNTNEQVTLTPTEKKIIKEFELSKIVVVTDAGLASGANRKFNNIGGRSFVTTQSIKKLKDFLKDWALDKAEWKMSGSNKIYNLDELEKDEKTIDEFKDKIFYKERWINEDDLEQRLIVTFSLKYKYYQQNIRSKQVERAEKLISSNPKNVAKPKQNDYKRFISKINITGHGEICEETIYELDSDLVNKEAKFDGFYAVCTNLEDEVNEIIKINRRRWEIEESFRIMKSEFKARPIYLKRDDRIIAHFTTCFLALMIFRYLKKKLKEEFTAFEIIDCLRDYNFREITGDGYLPSYTPNSLTYSLHNAFSFKTNYEIVSDKKMKNICKDTKK